MLSWNDAAFVALASIKERATPPNRETAFCIPTSPVETAMRVLLPVSG
jgi:hypothetical protein